MGTIALARERPRGRPLPSPARRWRRQHAAVAVVLGRADDAGRFHRLDQARSAVVADLEPTLRRKDGERLSYRLAADRRRIHRYAYEGSPWVDLDAIEAEAAEIMVRDPAQAERFFGNRLVYGAGSWLTEGSWEGAYVGARSMATQSA